MPLKVKTDQTNVSLKLESGHTNFSTQDMHHYTKGQS